MQPVVHPRVAVERTRMLNLQLFLIGREELDRDPRPLEIAGWRKQVTLGLCTPTALRTQLSRSREATLVRVYAGVTGRRIPTPERTRWLASLPMGADALEMARAIEQDWSRHRARMA